MEHLFIYGQNSTVNVNHCSADDQSQFKHSTISVINQISNSVASCSKGNILLANYQSNWVNLTVVDSLCGLHRILLLYWKTIP